MPTTRKFKAVLFDLGGTLVKTVDVPEIFRRILEAYGVKVSIDSIAKVHSANQREHDVEEMAKLGQEYWVRWNLRVLEKLGIGENKQFLARKIDELWWKYAELAIYPEVKETLFQLRSKGIKTGIVTNGLERDFKQILQKLDLTNHFDVVVGVDACKKAKPDKEIFLYAVYSLHLRPEEAIFVGDSIEYDYEGAKKAGLHPIMIDRKAKISADVEIVRSLTEVLVYF